MSTPTSMRSLAVLIACHNRKAKTLACLDALQGQAAGLQARGWRLQVVLFDDGSTDGTADAVRERHPATQLLFGDGQQFWNRSMHAAFAAALAEGHDAYLWLNDDTLLYGTALEVMVESLARAKERLHRDAVVVGATQDPDGGHVTYGAGLRSDPRWRPFRYQLLSPSGDIQPVDVMNGNCVLVPDTVARTVGNIDAHFEHGMGDTDYALRAHRAGVPLVLATAYVGTCARNPIQGSIRDPALTLRQRWQVAMSRKGLPPRSWWRICRRHGGPLWPLHFGWGYLHILIGRRR